MPGRLRPLAAASANAASKPGRSVQGLSGPLDQHNVLFLRASAMTTPIEADPPENWHDLETQVARILRECGYEVELQKAVKLARGAANIDVWAEEQASPPNAIAVE